MAEEQKRDRQGQQHEEQEEEIPTESPPSKSARVSDAVALELGLGLLAEDAASAKSVFTFMQMQEFHHQSLIYKHMVAGIPVPVHLILPIWKSVAASYGPHHYPSFAGLGNLCYDFRNSMEPEPGRCRRTDGKKWRCSRDAVPEQKYCERHLHRGRNRSRKPVEGGGGGGGAAYVAPTAAVVTTSTTANLSDGPNNHGNNSNSSSNIDMNSNHVSVAARIGSSPVSVLSSSTTCKTGAS